MANIFKLTKGYVDKPKRNVYDLSYTSNITCNFGTLYPVFCKEVNPGDSMSIDTSFGLRAQPMIFPIQTRMRADVHYFYVRNRTLWKDWMDFYGRTKDNLVHPYIDRNIGDFKTGSIYDYLGVPTTVMSNDYYSDMFAVNPQNFFNSRISTGKDVAALTVANLVGEGYRDPYVNINKRLSSITSVKSERLFFNSLKFNSSNPSSYDSFLSLVSPNFYYNSSAGKYVLPCWTGSFHSIDEFNLSKLYSDSKTFSFRFVNSNFNGNGDTLTSISCYVMFFMAKSSQNSQSITTREIYSIGSCFRANLRGTEYASPMLYFDCATTSGYRVFNSSVYDDFVSHGFDLIMPVFLFSYGGTSYPENPTSTIDKIVTGIYNIGSSYLLNAISSSNVVDSSKLNYLPWCGNDKKLKINALPYRAYQAIYNSFYRNVQNDPFFIDGVAEYNKYITNDEGGADQYPYQLYQRNWELDFLTSAVQSPQQGLAPLVGVTINNKDQQAIFEFRSTELEAAGVPEGKVKAVTTIGEGGDVTGISYYDSELPQSNLQNLMTAINYGISINDIRQTNALQRWLEKNIRRGYRYRDQLISHFGVNVSFNELLMPEFIGGCSQDVETQTIYQTVTNENGYLGDFAGRGSVVGQSKNRVSKYCDEAGFIIGIMSIVPIPVYSQIPAGYCFHNDLLDYYFPEFGKIGMQPIYNYHVTPLQTTPTELNNVFGYQRPWWHLISSVDEVHGEFRSTANGYLIHRQFVETPQLNGNFLKIDNDYINDVFAITNSDVSNQFLGVINFHVTKKTAIPLHGEPSIE